MSATQIIERGYKVVLSTKHEIAFDPDELPKVMQAIQTGTSVLLRKGLFNPSYYVCVVEDEKRRIEFLEDTKYEKPRRLQGMQALGDIFNNRRALPGVAPDGTLTLKKP